MSSSQRDEIGDVLETVTNLIEWHMPGLTLPGQTILSQYRREEFRRLLDEARKILLNQLASFDAALL